MKQRRHYEAPEILRQTVLGAGCELLQKSIVDNVTVTTMGQEVETHTAGTDFRHNWE